MTTICQARERTGRHGWAPDRVKGEPNRVFCRSCGEQGRVIPWRKKPIHWEVGDRVTYDDNPGVVVRRIRSERDGSDNYVVKWDDTGDYAVAWGSDLSKEGEDDD